MRLGFHYHVPALLKSEGIYMPGYLGRFIDSLAGLCEGVVCFLHNPRPDELDRMDYRIVSPNVRLVDIGPHASTIQRTLKARRYASFLRDHDSDLDLLLVRGPSPLLPAMVSASPVPTALLLVGDYLAGVDDLPQPRWRKEAIRLWVRWNKWGQMCAARRSLTFVNSRVLYRELHGQVADLHEVRTTTLTRDDFFERADTCQKRPVRLLYVGRMDRAKGLFEMVQALVWLREHGEDVVLDLVGWAERGDPILEEIRVLAREKGIAGALHYAGPRPLGPELFAFYRRADIFVIASLASEGFPRTIWEAMAHSLPVVATDVGSIRQLINDTALIISPDRPDMISDAVLRIIHDKKLRQKMVQRGFDLAKTMTLEVQTKKLVQLILEYVHNQ